MLIFGTLALSYDVLFGFTGLLSFGHALCFSLGTYAVTVAGARYGLDFASAVLITLAMGILVPLVVGAVCLRVSGIAFAMVTLAFAEAGAILAVTDPFDLTGGANGVAVDIDLVPSIFVGVYNTKYVYWLSLALLSTVALMVWWVTRSPLGRTWQAVRENELRVEVLGLRPYWFKLSAFVFGSFLASLCGIAFALLEGGASLQSTTATFSLTVLVMVIIGGSGRIAGAVLGGVLYTYADTRLVNLSDSGFTDSLPNVLAVPLAEPEFLLGAAFVLLVMFLPGGVASLRERIVAHFGPRGTAK